MYEQWAECNRRGYIRLHVGNFVERFGLWINLLNLVPAFHSILVLLTFKRIDDDLKTNPVLVIIGCCENVPLKPEAPFL